MRQQRGLVDNGCPKYVCKFNRTLYVLKQAARGFYETLSDYLGRCRLYPLRNDTAVFFGKFDDCDTWAVAYVKNLVVIGRDDSIAEKEKLRLRRQFILKYLEFPSEFIEISLVYDNQRRTLRQSHSSAIPRSLKKFKMSYCKSIKYLIEKKVVALLQTESQPAHYVQYRQSIRYLLYFWT